MVSKKTSSNVPDGGKKAIKVNQRLYAMLALVLLYIFFAFFGRNFSSYETLINIFDASYYIGFLAIGITFVIITGGIDLSVGTVAMCAAMVGGVAWDRWHWPFWLSLILIVITGAIFGLLNGVLVSRLKLPPFIATLGTMMISLAISSIVSKVQSVNFPSRLSDWGWFKDVFSKILVEKTNSTYPTGAVFLIAALLIAFVVLNKTRIGRYTFAIGSNEEAARLSGVNVAFWKTMPYIISGTFAGISGIFYAATYSTVVPGAGQGFELDAIAGVVIGGTSLSGGVGSVMGTLIGVMIMSVLRIGLPSMDFQPHYQKLFTGIVVIIAVLMDISQQKKRT